MRKLLSLAGLVALLAVTATASADRYIGGKWRQPQNVHLYDLTPERWHSSVQRAVDLWNKSAYVHIDYRVASSCPTHGESVCVIERTPGCWGYATVFMGRGVIRPPVTVTIGDDSCDPAQYPGYEDYLTCHEIGHTLGIADDASYGPDTCAAGGTFDNGVFTNTTPGVEGYAELETIYG